MGIWVKGVVCITHAQAPLCSESPLYTTPSAIPITRLRADQLKSLPVILCLVSPLLSPFNSELLNLVFPMQSLSLRTDWHHSQAPESFSADLTDQSWSVHSIVSCLGLVKINVRMVLCGEHFPTEPSPGPCLRKPSVSPNENCYSSLLSPLFLT